MWSTSASSEGGFVGKKFLASTRPFSQLALAVATVSPTFVFEYWNFGFSAIAARRGGKTVCRPDIRVLSLFQPVSPVVSFSLVQSVMVLLDHCRVLAVYSVVYV